MGGVGEAWREGRSLQNSLGQGDLLSTFLRDPFRTFRP